MKKSEGKKKWSLSGIAFWVAVTLVIAFSIGCYALQQERTQITEYSLKVCRAVGGENKYITCYDGWSFGDGNTCSSCDHGCYRNGTFLFITETECPQNAGKDVFQWLDEMPVIYGHSKWGLNDYWNEVVE